MRRLTGPSLLLSAIVAIGLGSWEAREPQANEVRAAKQGKSYAWTFAADTLGQAPAHSKIFGGVWSVMGDSADSAGLGGAAPSGDSSGTAERFIRQSEDDDGVAYHYLCFTRPFLKDFDLSVRFRIVSGELDPAAGLLFQMDPKGKNGYLLRVSGKTNELVFHYLLSGKRRDVRMGKIEPPELNTWHTISLTRRKSVLRASYDGTEVMMVRDERYSSGIVGLWTEDDTIVDFAGLTAIAR